MSALDEYNNDEIKRGDFVIIGNRLRIVDMVSEEYKSIWYTNYGEKLNYPAQIAQIKNAIKVTPDSHPEWFI